MTNAADSPFAPRAGEQFIVVEKVTLFVTRQGTGGPELLLFEHSNGSFQIPAGTVEPGEEPQAAALREGHEETGLADLGPLQALGCIDTNLAPDRRMVASPTAVYRRPDVESGSCAELPRGLTVRVERATPGFLHITYTEFERRPEPGYISYQITGWMPESGLTALVRRHFYRCDYSRPTPERWPVRDGVHHWVLFWAPLGALPPLSPSQSAWLRMDPFFTAEHAEATES